MTSDWWANTSGETSTWNWTGTSFFYNWITENEDNDDYGIHGKAYIVPNYLAVGDYIYMPGHVMLVTKIVDNNGNGVTDYNEIYISAHTNDREDYHLKTLYENVGNPPSSMRFMRVFGFKWNEEMYN